MKMSQETKTAVEKEKENEKLYGWDQLSCKEQNLILGWDEDDDLDPAGGHGLYSHV